MQLLVFLKLLLTLYGNQLGKSILGYIVCSVLILCFARYPPLHLDGMQVYNQLCDYAKSLDLQLSWTLLKSQYLLQLSNHKVYIYIYFFMITALCKA